MLGRAAGSSSRWSTITPFEAFRLCCSFGDPDEFNELPTLRPGDIKQTSFRRSTSELFKLEAALKKKEHTIPLLPDAPEHFSDGTSEEQEHHLLSPSCLC